MSKTAPATASPVRGGKVGSRLAIAIAAGLAVFVYGVYEGWWGSVDGRETESPEESRVEISLQVVWGLMVATGEDFEDTDKPITEFHSDDRQLVINYWINGELYPADQHESDVETPGIWRRTTTVPAGSTVTLQVTQEQPGWLMGTIEQSQMTVALKQIDDAGMLEVEHIVFGV